MANKNPNKSGLTPFPKGNPLAANGGRAAKLPEELRGINKITKDQYQRLATKYLETDVETLEKLAVDGKLPAKDAYFVRMILSTLQSGDPKPLEPIWSRLVGKPIEEVELTDKKKLVAIKRFEGGVEYIGFKDVVHEYLDVKKEDSDESGD